MRRALVIASLAVIAPMALHGTAASASEGDGPDVVAADAELRTAGARLAERGAGFAPAPGSAIEVKVEVALLGVLAIDERNSQFDVDAQLNAEWVDKDLLDPDCVVEPMVFSREAAEEILQHEVWSPEFVVVDGRTPRSTSALQLSIWCDGRIRYEERFATTIAQQFTELNDFPFDDHEVDFVIEPFGNIGARELRFVEFPEVERTDGLGTDKIADQFDSEEWDFTIEDSRVVEAPPQVITTINIDRKSRYYVSNVIIPLALIVTIAWTVFRMRGDFANRITVSITVLLTVVAFDFLTTNDLPRLSFTTRLDAFYNWSYVLVASTILVSVLVKTFPDRKLAGNRFSLDGVAAVAFFPVYAVVLATTLAFGWFSPGPADRSDPDAPDVVVEAGATRLTLGEPVAGRIAEAGELDEVEVCADGAGATIATMRRTGSFDVAFDPLLRLFDENDEFVTSDDDGAGGLDSQLVLPPSGCYRLVASDLFDESVGDYTLELSAGDDGTLDAIDGDLSGAVRLEPGSPMRGEITEALQADVYETCADAGDLLIFTMIAAGGPEGGLDPYLEVLSPDEVLLDADDDGAGGLDSALDFAVAEAGCFLLVARDLTLEGLGAYTVAVDVMEGAVELDPSELESAFGLTFDELDGRDLLELTPDSVEGGTISDPGEVDGYRVCANEGDAVTLTMTRTVGTEEDLVDPILAVYGPEGALVGFDDDGAGGLDSRLRFVAETEACYVVVAADLLGLETGPYSLSFVVE